MVMRRKPQPGCAHHVAELRPGAVEALEEHARCPCSARCRQHDRAVARVLVDLALTGLALFAQLFERLARPRSCSCKMMLAETYGMMPSAKIDSCSSAPPENMLNMPEKAGLCVAMICCITLRSTPGVVTKIPMR